LIGYDLKKPKLGFDIETLSLVVKEKY